VFVISVPKYTTEHTEATSGVVDSLIVATVLHVYTLLVAESAVVALTSTTKGETLMNSREANAQSDLTVTIEAPLPVPVSITGTSTISGTVGLAPGASVQIDNTDPVRVSNVNDVIQPFQASNLCYGPAGSGGCTVAIFTVPAGKRAVVEYFNGFANFTDVAAAGQVALVALRTTVAGIPPSQPNGAPLPLLHNLPTTPPAVSNLNAPGAGICWGQQVRLYADSGTTIDGTGIPSTTESSYSFQFNISGYLVDVP